MKTVPELQFCREGGSEEFFNERRRRACHAGTKDVATSCSTYGLAVSHYKAYLGAASELTVYMNDFLAVLLFLLNSNAGSPSWSNTDVMTNDLEVRHFCRKMIGEIFVNSLCNL